MTNLEKFDPTIIKLAKTWKISPLKWEDVAQELRLHLLKKERTTKTPINDYKNWAYISCRNKIRDLAKYYHRAKRDVRNETSLDELKEKGFDKSV
jgi:DNA-directed RNA polymerase specialized sigma24 family protein